MPRLPLDQEQHVPIGPLGGQHGRVPVTAVSAGKAAVAEGSYHDGQALRSAPGTVKMTDTPIPPSGYEIDGISTGFLKIPKATGVDYDTDDWAVEWNVKLLNAGGIKEDENKTQLLAASALDSGQISDMDTTGRGMFITLITKPNATPPPPDDAIYIRLNWNGVVWGTDLLMQIGGTDIDLEDWFKVHVAWTASSETVTITVRQPQNFTGSNSESQTQAGVIPRVDFWSLGGRISTFSPVWGHRNICHSIVSEFRHYSATTGGNKDTYERRVPGDTAEPTLVQVWPLDDSETLAVRSVPTGNEASLTGNRVHRDVVSSFGSGDGKCLYFDGSGQVFIPNAHKFRDPPGADLPGYYLERPEISFGFWFRPDPLRPFSRFIGWHDDPEEDKAVLLNWTTPETELWGRSETYGSYHSAHDAAAGGDTYRPSEHLKVEIAQNLGAYSVRAYWGELDRASLNHPDGTVGGETNQTWPPQPAADGKPPPTFNNPQACNGTGGATGGALAATSQNAQVCILGQEPSGSLGLDDPMSYDWLVIVQKKWVDQGDADNECKLVCVPFNRTTGAWESNAVFRYASGGTTTGYGLDNTVYLGSKQYPDDQSCFTLDYQGIVGVNHRPDVYTMTLGGQCPGRYGDEWLGLGGVWEGNANVGMLYPAQGIGPGFMVDKQGRGYPFVGWIKDFFVLKRYISLTDVKRIASSGGFQEAMRDHFSRDILESYTFGEGAGNILRGMKGNDITYEEKIITSDVQGTLERDPNEKQPNVLGFFPRVPPPRHNEVDLYSSEFSPVTGLVQRLDFEGNEEIYVTALTGLYRYTRSTHTLERILGLPGQGGPRRSSIVIDDADIIHIAGGPGRPVIITRDKTLALSGIEPPFYQAPSQLVTTTAGLPGGVNIQAQFAQSTNIDNLVGYELVDSQQVTIAVGYWSDVLKVRSAPGPAVTCRFTDPALPQLNTQPVKQHRILLTGLPLPETDNAALITHWEIFRTANNGDRMFLETRIPINDIPGSSLVGYKIDSALVDQADYWRAPPPEGIRYLGQLGDRLFGVGLPDRPRSLVWSRRGESTTFPPGYEYTLTHTATPAVGVRARRDRAFVISRDYLYQVFDKLSDIDPDGRIEDSVIITPITEGAGALNQDAIADDEENGLYLFGTKTVYLTEGGIFRSVSSENDSVGTLGGSWSWPGSWDVSDPDAFVSFHDEERHVIGICGPSADDPNRRDAMVIFYEGTQTTSSGETQVRVEMSRIKALNATTFAHVFNASTGGKEVWFGSDRGYIYRMNQGFSMGVDYSWLPKATPKYGFVLAAPTITTLRLDGSYSGVPSEFMVGAHLRIYNGSQLLSTRRVTDSTLSPSWIDVTVDGAHGASPGNQWTVGAIPLEWRTGEMDMGDALQDMRVLDVDLRLKRS